MDGFSSYSRDGNLRDFAFLARWTLRLPKWKRAGRGFFRKTLVPRRLTRFAILEKILAPGKGYDLTYDPVFHLKY
jgi:hypothetical protein